MGAKDTTRQELLDAELERALVTEGAARIRFASAADRREREDGYVRRLAERLAADIVVLTSLEELSGADWMNGRLYLKSGYLNRQALVRLESARAVALGRYLATGREIPGVLLPEEAAQLSGGAPLSETRAPVARSPWYADVVGWSLVGAGVTAGVLGLWARSVGQDRRDAGDLIRGDSTSQQAKYRSSQKWSFYGDVGVVGGGLSLLTGALLLAIPEYTDGDSELFTLRPLPGGGAFTFAGRF